MFGVSEEWTNNSGPHRDMTHPAKCCEAGHGELPYTPVPARILAFLTPSKRSKTQQPGDHCPALQAMIHKVPGLWGAHVRKLTASIGQASQRGHGRSPSQEKASFEQGYRCAEMSRSPVLDKDVPLL